MRLDYRRYALDLQNEPSMYNAYSTIPNPILYTFSDEQKYNSRIEDRFGAGDSQRAVGSQCLQFDIVHDEGTSGSAEDT